MRCSSTGCEENLGGMSLKCEQPLAVISLLDGKDVFAVLPTRLGKSLIFKAMRLRGVRDGRPPILTHSPPAASRRMPNVLGTFTYCTAKVIDL